MRLRTLTPYLLVTAGIGIGICVAMLVPNPFSRPKDDDDEPVAKKSPVVQPKPAAKVAETPVPPDAGKTAVAQVPPAPLPAEKPPEAPKPAAASVAKAAVAAAKEDAGLDAHTRERVAAAAVFIRAQHGGNSYQGCGVFCGSGLIAANARVLGIGRNSRELPADFNATVFSGALADPGKSVRFKSFDPDTGLLFFRANTWQTAPLALADDSALHAQMSVYFPRFTLINVNGGAAVGAAALAAGEITNVQMDPNASRLACVSVGAELDGGSAGTPFVDLEGRIVALAGIDAEATASCQTITCSDLRQTLKGRIGATLIRKTGEKPGGKYSFEIAVESIDPAEHISSVNFYYWTVKADAAGNANSGNMVRLPLAREETSARWSADVFDLAMPPGSKLFMQTGYYSANREETLSEPLDCAIQLGVPNAPAPAPAQVAAASAPTRSGRELNAPRVENVPQGGPTNSFFVGTQGTTVTETTYLISSSGAYTRIDYVYNVPPPPPPPDSPGWSLGYTPDPTSGHPTGDYERADRGYRNNNYNYDYGRSGSYAYPSYTVPNYNFNNYNYTPSYSPYVLRR